jgi:hypothetical protein
MPTPDELTALRRERERAQARALAAERRAAEIEAELHQAIRTHGDGESERVNRLREALESIRADAAGYRREHGHLTDAAASELGVWLRQTPEELVARLPDQDPFLLFPVRLETRFARTASGAAELRVRIWPDDIGVARAAGDLTDQERAHGEEYWQARAVFATTPGPGPAPDAARRAYEGAWTGIATSHGAYRASWIVLQTKPANWNDAAGAPAAMPLVFPPPSPSPTPRIARAEALPDRFVIVGSYQGQTLPDVVGNAIPDNLAIAPDPSQLETWIKRDAHGRLVVAEPWRWMVDFDTAVAVGMGIRVPLPPPWDTTGFDLLMAVGVRGATGPVDGLASVEALLSSHRVDDGCAIVRNGTPTNNTDTALSGWRPASTEVEQLFAIEDKPPDLTPTPGPLGECDGMRLVRLLGLSQAFVRRLPNATATDTAEALAMNRAASFATIFEFVKEFLNPLVSATTRASLRTFFHQYVSGRGALPALRIGRQPYGIVITSDWNTWTPEALRGTTLEQQLVALLRAHRPAWQQMAIDSARTGRYSSDPFARLMFLVGHLASSAQYLSRKSVTDPYVFEQLKFAGASREAQTLWVNELINRRRPNLNKILSHSQQSESLLSQILFTEQTDPWLGPIVDRDPKVPLSERDPIAPYSGTRNYLHWLAEASLNDLNTERFIGPQGTTISRPAALLYVLLRYSLLTAVEEGTLEIARTAGAKYFDVVARDPLVASIGGAQHVLRRDYLDVDAAKLGVATQAMSLSKWVHESAQKMPAGGVWSSALAVVTDANESIAALASVPTARLERLLAEHVDLCSYRMDAWITAIYAHRLDQMRRAQQRAGLYLGAYSWVEHLHPDWRERTRVDVEMLPASLRDGVTGPVFESIENGGFIHAPSLQQAATAAVLRNAYLSHASSDQPDLFSLNVSSARVRVAQTFIEGIRNGQSLAALLGYELERGLHERHPGLELDRYRYVLRDRFPFMAGKLTELKVGVNAEVVEARNVINGLDLLEHVPEGAYPSDIPGLPAVGTSEANAILEEIEWLRGALDAVSDLLLAESVHQAVQGNMERTKASLQALTEPEAAPDPEVIRTPRSTRLLTFRVALSLDPSATSQWPGSLTPRAAANPAVNAWLAQHLPAPGDIQWSVTNGASPAALASFAGLPLQPIDLVLMTGEQLGQLSSEVERVIVGAFRIAQGVPDDVPTRVAPLTGPPDDVPPLVFDFAAAAPGKHPLAHLHPLLLRLRRIIGRRAMHALDWLPSTEIKRVDAADPTGSASGDPKLFNLKDLNDRLDAGVAGLKAVKAALEAARGALLPLQPQVDAMRAALNGALGYGMPEALPSDRLALDSELVDTLSAQAGVVLGLIAKRISAIDGLRAPNVDPLPATEPERTLEIARRTTVALDRAASAAKELFGASFVIVPLYHLHQPDQVGEVSLSAASPVADAFEIEEWLHSAARVRPALADVTWAMATAAWMHTPIADPVMIQLPRLAGAPWIGGAFTTPLPDGEWLAIAALRSAASFSGLQCGLVLDEWTEDVPADSATTGVSFHFNRPNATAPQALLLAVPPIRRGAWQWDALKGSVREAYELARLRAIEPDALMTGGYFQGLPAILTEFSTNRFAFTDIAERSFSAFMGIP